MGSKHGLVSAVGCSVVMYEVQARVFGFWGRKRAQKFRFITTIAPGNNVAQVFRCTETYRSSITVGRHHFSIATAGYRRHTTEVKIALC